jgi:hypothetical protein
MKKLITLLFPALLFSQVGINTASPTETLDINGTLRVRNTPNGLPTDSLLVIRNGVVKKISMSSITQQNSGTCPNFLKNLSHPYYLVFSSNGSIPNPNSPIVISGSTFNSAGTWTTGNVYYYSYTRVSAGGFNINNFTVNFGSLLCVYN